MNYKTLQDVDEKGLRLLFMIGNLIRNADKIEQLLAKRVAIKSSNNENSIK